jgi:hypothetical protein
MEPTLDPESIASLPEQEAAPARSSWLVRVLPGVPTLPAGWRFTLVELRAALAGFAAALILLMAVMNGMSPGSRNRSSLPRGTSRSGAHGEAFRRQSMPTHIRPR